MNSSREEGSPKPFEEIIVELSKLMISHSEEAYDKVI